MSQKHGNLLLRIAGLQVSGVETPRILHELQSLLDPKYPASLAVLQRPSYFPWVVSNGSIWNESPSGGVVFRPWVLGGWRFSMESAVIARIFVWWVPVLRWASIWFRLRQRCFGQWPLHRPTGIPFGQPGERVGVRCWFSV